MIRSRWLALQATAVALAVSALPAARAQRGMCPYLNSGAMNLQMNYMPRAPMMMPQMPMHNFQPMQQPMLTPPRMPIAARPIQPMMPHNMPMTPPMTRVTMPGMNMHLPTLSGNFGLKTHTTNQMQWHTQTHTAKIPSLQWHHVSWGHMSGYGVPHGYGSGGGHGTGHWNWVTGIKRIPTLGWKTVNWTSRHMTRTSTTTAHLTGNLTPGSRTLRLPSLSINRRGPSLVPSRPQLGGPSKANPGLTNPIKPGTLTVRRPAPGTAPGKPGTGTGSLSVTGRLNMSCGKCHNCKQNANPNPGQIATLPMQPPRSPALPALAPPFVAPRPQLLVQVAPLVRQPFAPLLIAPGPTAYITPTPGFPQTIRPATLAINPSLLATLSAPPRLSASPGKALVAPPPASRETSMMTSTPMPTPAPVVTAIQLVAADLAPPSLAPVATPAAGNRLGLPNPAQLMVAPEPEKAAARPVAPPQRPSLVASLMQAPLLPSGATVSPREVLHSVLDDPPVLPVLADTLIQPPALRPLPGT